MDYAINIFNENKEEQTSINISHRYTFIFNYCGLYFVDYLQDKPKKMVSVNEIIPLLQNAIQKMYRVYYNSEEIKKLYEEYYEMLTLNPDFVYDLRIKKYIKTEDKKYNFLKYAIEPCIDFYEEILKECYINYDGFIQLDSY